MPARFFAPDLAPDRLVVPLPPEEADHLARVLRLVVGDLVSVFDGRGNEFVARIESVGRHEASVRPIARAQPAAETAVQITLAPAVLKGDRFDEVIRDASMLGVRAVQPIVSARAEIALAALHRSGRVERWRRVAIASVKQCGRAVVPDIRAPLSLSAFVEGDRSELSVMLVEPRAEGSSRFEALRERARPESATILAGPEGGWTDEEIRHARARGVVPVTLGSRTLRADAVPVAGLSVLLFLWGDL